MTEDRSNDPLDEDDILFGMRIVEDVAMHGAVRVMNYAVSAGLIRWCARRNIVLHRDNGEDWCASAPTAPSSNVLHLRIPGYGVRP